MDTRTTWLGFELEHPFVPSASPLSKSLDKARALEDAGAPALVMYSLFEETIRAEEAHLDAFLMEQDIGHGEASTFRPLPASMQSTLEQYLEQVRKLKQALSIPVVASLNGTTAEGWLEHARDLQAAGADAIELNLYELPTRPDETAENIEARKKSVVRMLSDQVSLPVNVKVSSQFTAPVHALMGLEEAGADGLCIFNRFYQPDIALSSLSVEPHLQLSSPQEALQRIHWAAILRPHLKKSLGVTGGFHTAEDSLKALLVGADVVHLCSLLLKRGPDAIREIREDLLHWMETLEYESLEELKGSMMLTRSEDPGAWARLNYMETLNSLR
jgi:dihydroorotate dehydrogenase (fumarate)